MLKKLTGIESDRSTLKIVYFKSSRNGERRCVTTQITALFLNKNYKIFGSCPVVHVAGKQVYIIFCLTNRYLCMDTYAL